MPFAVTQDNTRIFYTSAGAGPPVLFLHGWACDGNDWSWQTPELEFDFTVIVVDHRGHGRSDTPEGSYRDRVRALDGDDRRLSARRSCPPGTGGGGWAPRIMSSRVAWSGSTKARRGSADQSSRGSICATVNARGWPYTPTSRRPGLERELPLGELDEIHVLAAGHFLHQEAAAEFNQLARSWIDRVALAGEK